MANPRMVLVELRVKMLTEVPDDFSEDEARFAIEDSRCLGNLVDQIYAEAKPLRDEGLDNICWRAEAQLLEFEPDAETVKRYTYPTNT